MFPTCGESGDNDLSDNTSAWASHWRAYNASADAAEWDEII